MIRRGASFLLGLAALLTTAGQGRADVLVTLGKPVTLVGTFGSAPALASTLTDGLFLPKNTLFQSGTVWWNGNASPGNTILIDLEGTFVVTALSVQADDNDAYILEYLDPSNTWVKAWDVPNFDFEPFGMQTRPNPLDDTEVYVLPTPITASAFRFSGNDASGDRLYAVSEIQAFGRVVPEPSSLALAAIGAVGLAGLAARRRRPGRSAG